VVQLHIDAAFGHGDLFGFEQLALETGVGFTDQKFAARTNYAVPGNAFALRRSGHGASCRSRAAWQAQGPSEITISNNPAAGNLFHEAVNGVPRHFPCVLQRSRA